MPARRRAPQGCRLSELQFSMSLFRTPNQPERWQQNVKLFLRRPLAGPFKARTNGFHEKSVAAATVESGVAAAPHYSPDDPFPALKGWERIIRPLRGQLRN
jgi:hypothetical protein